MATTFMECKFIRVLIVATFCFSISGCWLADENESKGERNLIGNIKIWGIENGVPFEVVFYESSHRIVPILQNCSVIYYDSMNNIILAHEQFNEYNTFYKVQIIDATKHPWYRAVKKTEITSEEFNSSVNNKMKKWGTRKNE